MTTELLPIEDLDLEHQTQGSTTGCDIVTAPASLTDVELNTAFDRECTFTRKAQKRFRERTLPILMDVERRFAAGQPFCGFTSLHAYYISKGLNPATVRQWKHRARLLTDGEVPAKLAKLAKSRIPEMRLPTVAEHGFELSHNICNMGFLDHVYVWICPYSKTEIYEQGEFFHIAVRFDSPFDNADLHDAVVSYTDKPVRANYVLHCLEAFGVVSWRLKQFEWTEYEVPIGLDKNIYALDPKIKKSDKGSNKVDALDSVEHIRATITAIAMGTLVVHPPRGTKPEPLTGVAQ